MTLQKLFNYLSDNGFTPLESDMQEVINIVREIDEDYIRKDSIKAKPLELEGDKYHSFSKCNLYRIYCDSEDHGHLGTEYFTNAYMVDYLDEPIQEEFYKSFDEAKAAAQEHYDNFIKSQIS